MFGKRRGRRIGHTAEQACTSFLTAGILAGTLSFAASLTPSLIPRSYLVQGGLSGLSAAHRLRHRRSCLVAVDLSRISPAAGPGPEGDENCGRRRVRRDCRRLPWKTLEWQNSIRVLMDIAPLDTASPLKTGAVAVAVFAILMLLAHLFRYTFLVFSNWLGATSRGGFPVWSAACWRSRCSGRRSREWYSGSRSESWTLPSRNSMR